jgi:hypothetical protein
MTQATIYSTPLLDLLPPSDVPSKGVPGKGVADLADRAARLIDFADAEYQRIAELDLGMGRLSLRYTDPQGATAMRRLYLQWVVHTEELLERVRGCGLRDRLGAKYEELERAAGQTRAMLSVTLESLSAAAEQFRRGETFSLEEVRRELRAAAGR